MEYTEYVRYTTFVRYVYTFLCIAMVEFFKMIQANLVALGKHPISHFNKVTAHYII